MKKSKHHYQKVKKIEQKVIFWQLISHQNLTRIYNNK